MRDAWDHSISLPNTLLVLFGLMLVGKEDAVDLLPLLLYDSSYDSENSQNSRPSWSVPYLRRLTRLEMLLLTLIVTNNSSKRIDRDRRGYRGFVSFCPSWRRRIHSFSILSYLPCDYD
jgi:hypothetical protein